MAVRSYEITFYGEAVPAIVAAFEEFDVIVGCGTTTIRSHPIDQPALHGAIDRLQSLGLELLQVMPCDDMSAIGGGLLGQPPMRI